MVGAVIGVTIESIVGFDDIDGISDPVDWAVIDDAATWDWLSRVLNKSGKFGMDEMVEYWFGLVYSCDEKGNTVGDATKLVAIDSYTFSSKVWPLIFEIIVDWDNGEEISVVWSNEVDIDGCPVAAVLPTWLFAMVFSDTSDGEFWVETIEGIGVGGRVPPVCSIVAACVPMVSPTAAMPVCVLFEDGDKLWFRRICEDCVGRKLSVFCCSVIGEGPIGCDAGELFISLFSAVVGNNDPFWLGIVDETFAEERVSRACWTVMNDGVVNTEFDDTFVCVSLKEDTKLWFGKIDDAGTGWKVLPVSCPVPSDIGETLVNVLFVDNGTL